MEKEEKEKEAEGSRDEQKTRLKYQELGSKTGRPVLFLSLLAVGKGAAAAEPFLFIRQDRQDRRSTC
jgi:hypothetical protein